MVGSAFSRLLRAAAGTKRVPLVLTMALGVLAANAASAGAQWHLFESGVDAYRRQLAEFKDRAAALIRQIDDVPVGGVYCDTAEKLAAGRALAELRAELGDLERDWNSFKGGVNGSVEVSGPGSQFAKAGIDPLAPGFWTQSNTEVIQGPQKALDAKLELYRKTRVVNCSDPAARRNPPPAPVDSQKKDPLAGLKRPARFLQGIPSIPKPFCTQQEYEAWKKAIAAMLRANQDASTALRNYQGEIYDRLAPALRSYPMDSAAVRAFDAEMAWIKGEQDRLHRIYYQILAIYEMKPQFIDCSQHLTPPPPPSPKDSTPRPSAPVDTTHPHTLERPGTGTPSGVEPPKTGAIPGAKVRGEWRIGAGIDESWYAHLDHVAGDLPNVVGLTGKQTTPGWFFDLEFDRDGWNVRGCVHGNRLHFTQYVTLGSPFSRVDGDLDGTFSDLSVGRRFRFAWKTYIEVEGGVTYAYDYLGLDPITPLGVSLEQSHRSLQTWKTNFGLAIERPLSPDLNWRVNTTYTGAGTPIDADENIRVAAGLSYRLPFHFGR